jgi:hypothetical protein
MVRLARVVSLAIVAPSMVTVERVTPSAVQVARRPLVSAPVSHPTLGAELGTARLVLVLGLETVAPPMDIVEVPLLTVDRVGKFTFSIISVL